MTFENSRIVDVGYVEIPVEKIVDGEVVVIDTKAIPIIPQKE